MLRFAKFNNVFNNTLKRSLLSSSFKSFSSLTSTEEEFYHYSKVFINKPAPSFNGTAVIDGTFKNISLNDYKDKWIVLFFYPLDWTFVCPTEIIEFSDSNEAFKKINAEVIGCSVDSKFSHLSWIQTPRSQGGLGELKIPLLSDLTHTISRDYGVYMEENGHTARGTFIIDPKGKVRHYSVNDPPAGRNVAEYLRLINAYQYADVNGEVCPANWQPGKPTIKPNPKEKLKYFEAVNKKI